MYKLFLLREHGRFLPWSLDEKPLPETVLG